MENAFLQRSLIALSKEPATDPSGSHQHLDRSVSPIVPENLRSSGRKLFSGSLLRVGNLVAAGVAALFLMPFIVHHIGDRLYGFWSLAAGFIGYYGLLDLGLSSAVSQYICIAIGQNDQAECRRVFNGALRIQLMLGGVALIATAIIAAAAPKLCQTPADATLFWKVIIILGVNAALSFPARVYGGLLDAELRFDIRSWLTLVGLALRTGLLIWALVAGGGLLALAWATLFASLPIMALQVWFAKREAPWARIDASPLGRQRIKNLSSYSIYTFVTSIADALRFQIDPFVISGFVGLAAVTHYRVASVLMQYYINTIVSCTGTFQPLLSRLHGSNDRSGLHKVFYFATKVSICISTFIGFSLIGWGRPFIRRWMGSSYEDAYLPLVVLSLAVFLDVCQSPSITLLYATFNHRVYTYVNVAEGIINVLLSLALARPFGILGVALGTLIAAVLIRVVAQPFLVCKASGIPYGYYMRFVGMTLLRCSCTMGVAIAISSWGLRASYPHLIVSSMCATALYAAGSWFAVFTSREREQLISVITNRTQEPPELILVVPGIRSEE